MNQFSPHATSPLNQLTQDMEADYNGKLPMWTRRAAVMIMLSLFSLEDESTADGFMRVFSRSPLCVCLYVYMCV